MENPAARNGHAMAYDAARGQIVLYGGADSGLSSAIHYVTDTWLFRYQRPAALEGCGTGVDGDGDSLVGCGDPDCFGYCTPSCNPTLMVCDAAWSHCGDGTCQPIETKRLCPADCGAPVPRCGDFVCESPETTQSCPGDCL